MKRLQGREHSHVAVVGQHGVEAALSPALVDSSVLGEEGCVRVHDGIAATHVLVHVQ